MKNNKKLFTAHTIAAISIFALCISIFGIWFYLVYLRFDNVFEQLYHTEGSRFGQMADTGLHGRLEDVETGGRRVIYSGDSLERNRSFVIETNQIVPPFPETRPTLFFSFRQDFPDSNESIILSWAYFLDTKELYSRTLSISSPLYFEEYILGHWGSYEAYELFLSQNNIQHDPEAALSFTDSENQEVIDDLLSRHNLTRKEIEELRYWFLFEYFLPLWYETTNSRTRFSPDNWGTYALIDSINGFG